MTGEHAQAPICGARVLYSKTARALLGIWLLVLAAFFVLPGDLRRRLRQPGSEELGEQGGALAGLQGGGPGGFAELPGLAGAIATQRAGKASSATASAAAALLLDPTHVMRHFYDSLHATEGKQPGAITRILHIGDSLVDLDHISGPLRESFKRRFGDAGHGFVLAAKPWNWYNHPGIALAASDDWELFRLVGGKKKDGRLGLGFSSITSVKGRGWVKLVSGKDTLSSQIETYYLQQPGGGTLTLSVDGEVKAQVSTGGNAVRSGHHVLGVPDGPHDVRAAASGTVRLFGFVLERKTAGVTVENLPLISARFIELALLDETHFAEQLQLRRPKLIIYQFGANDSISYGGDLGRYQAQVETVLARTRKALPASSCLVLGPLDRLARGKGGELESPRGVVVVSAAQKRAALAQGCAFVDGQAAMGGAGSMKAWVKARLVRNDLVHLNASGSRRFAAVLEPILLAGYAPPGSSGTTPPPPSTRGAGSGTVPASRAAGK